jgi:hypothetical protein
MATFRTVGLAVAAVVTLAFAVPLGIMIKYLRGKVVREAILRASPTTQRHRGDA